MEAFNSSEPQRTCARDRFGVPYQGLSQRLGFVAAFETSRIYAGGCLPACFLFAGVSRRPLLRLEWL